MVLPSTGPISFANLRTEFSISGGPISYADIRGWTTSYVQWYNTVSLSMYRGTTYTTYRYPPTTIGRGDTWKKSESNRSVVYNGTTYTNAREQLKRIYNQSYGGGLYKAYASETWYTYNNSLGLTFSTYEMPVSGVFDATTVQSGGTNWGGYASPAASYNSGSDKSPPVVIGIELPFPITVRSYAVQNRADSNIEQSPTKWTLQASSDLSTWIDIDSRSGISWSTLGQTQTFTLSGLYKYKYWRILIFRANGINVFMTLGELYFNAPEYLTSYSWFSDPRNPIPYTATPQLDRLSSIANIKGAWGTRLLRQAYTGPCFTVRRSTDNATSNVYVNHQGYACIDAAFTTTLRSWLGTNTAYISTWYDQSGAGNNGTQTNTAYQPYFTADVNSYVASLYITFPNNCYFDLPNSTIPDGNKNYTLFVHHAAITGVTHAAFIGAGIGSNNQALNLRSDGTTGYWNYWWSNDTYLPNYAHDNRVTATYDGSTVRGYTNSGVVVASAKSGRNTATTNNYLGRCTAASEFLNGQLYTIVVFERVISEADRLILEC